MAKIRVGQRRSKLTFSGALYSSSAGDVIELHEGTHPANSVFFTNLQIVGVGDPRKIIIVGQLDPRGQCRITGVTIQAPPYYNAINMKTPGARLELDDCLLHGEPAGKYPAVYTAGAVVMMRNSVVDADKASPGVVVESSGEFHATNSDLGLVRIVGSRAFLASCAASSISCEKRSSLEASRGLTLAPGKDARLLVIEGESACRIEVLRTVGSAPEAFCDESYLRLDGVTTAPDETLVVLTEGQSRVETASTSVSVKDSSESAPPAAPKIVLWPLADARSFSTAIAPKLLKGDTVLLEEGEYFLEDYPDSLCIGVDLSGKGRGERTVIHGTLEVMDGCSVTLSNLTLRPAKDRNALVAPEGTSVTLANVVVEYVENSSASSFILKGGTATISGCTFRSTADPQAFSVDAGGGAHIEATQTDLGWLGVIDGSTADLTACTAIHVSAAEAGVINSTDGLFISPKTDAIRGLVITSGSEGHFDTVTTDCGYFEAFTDSATLDIGQLSTQDQGVAVIQFTNDSSVHVDGDNVTLEDLDAPTTLDTDKAAATSAPTGSAQMSTAEPNVEPTTEDTTEDTASRHDNTEIHAADDPLASIMSLTGLATVKEEISSFTRMVRFNQLRKERGLKDTGLTMHSVFLGNPGTGKTTVARLLSEALFDAGAIERDVCVEVGRQHLVGEHLGESANLTQAVLESARGGVLFVDEAYSLYKENHNEFAQEAVDTILKFMEDNRSDIVVIFAGYADRMQDFLGMNPGLKSRVPNRFDFEDYSPGEVADIGYRALVEQEYVVDEDIYRRAVSTAYARSTEHSNGRWVRNFNDKLIQRMAQRVLDSGTTSPDDLTHITDNDVYSLTGGQPSRRKEEIERLLGQLDDMIGLAPVKGWVRRLVQRVQVDQQRMELDGTISLPNYHMVFAGSPGTGKTTVANIVGQLFHALGILKSPTVKVVDRSHLIGPFIGHTEKRTARVLDEAMGGVLFIDEAYQLTKDASSNDFGQQAVETLMTRLENDRGKFVAIFAGYTEQMDRFLDANPGLRSRVPLTIEFPDYAPEEVARIAANDLAKRWNFDRDTLIAVAERAYDAVDPRDKSNGRWARNFVERIESAQSSYVADHGIVGSKITYIPTEVIVAEAATDGPNRG